jgi:diguanylate cyclase (GGDEF)-like protein/PAS domain S-box-containing protein
MPALDDPEIYRGVMESLPVGVCVVDIEKRIVLWSSGAEQITGHMRHEVIGHTCIGEALLHCDQPGCEFCSEECPLARAIKTAQPTEAIGFLHHKDGHEIPLRVRAVPVHNAHGSIVGAVETFEEQSSADDEHREEGFHIPGALDEETRVASRTMMRAHLRETLGTFSELQVPFSVLYLRLEGLAHFRSSFGPKAASRLLRVVAKTLETALWKSDFVGRWAEDEFLVILNGCRCEDLPLVRERLRRMVANDSIEWWGDRRSLPVTIGQATAQMGDSVESLLERAQKSLEAASPRRARAVDGRSNEEPSVED